jgi:hypothetical protein
MEEPASYDLHFLQDYIETEEMGPTWLFGKDSSTWGSKEHRDMHASDLLTIKPPLKMDAFSNIIISKFVDFLFNSWGLIKAKSPKSAANIVYKQNSLLRITHSITCFVASVLPLLAVIVLSYMPTFKLRIAILVVCNLLFAVCLSVFTEATRPEVFGVTAA